MVTGTENPVVRTNFSLPGEDVPAETAGTEAPLETDRGRTLLLDGIRHILARRDDPFGNGDVEQEAPIEPPNIDNLQARLPDGCVIPEGASLERAAYLIHTTVEGGGGTPQERTEAAKMFVPETPRSFACELALVGDPEDPLDTMARVTLTSGPLVWDYIGQPQKLQRRIRDMQEEANSMTGDFDKYDLFRQQILNAEAVISIGEEPLSAWTMIQNHPLCSQEIQGRENGFGYVESWIQNQNSVSLSTYWETCTKQYYEAKNASWKKRTMKLAWRFFKDASGNRNNAAIPDHMEMYAKLYKSFRSKRKVEFVLAKTREKCDYMHLLEQREGAMEGLHVLLFVLLRTNESILAEYRAEIPRMAF